MLMTIIETDFESANQVVEEAQSIVLVTHVFPDGDAIGSLLGLSNALLSLGKKIDFAVDGGVPDFLEFLPGSQLVKKELTDGSWDLMISVDSSDEERTGKAGEYGRANSKKVINLDHHPTNVMFGDIFLVNSEAVSAAEIVFNWLQAMNFEFNADVARPLLAGMVTDTLGFRTSNVSAGTLGIAQTLMSAGASLAEITERALNNKSFAALSVWKHALPTVKMYKGVISVDVTRETLERIGVDAAMDGGLSSFLVRVNEAMISVVFKEDKDGNVVLSMRAKPGFNVSDTAFSLGGGGHVQASGATIPGPLEDAKKRVLPMLRKAVKKGKPVFA
jgi:bifunctional oligoribonuclease and PAP phosphatase NrnA